MKKQILLLLFILPLCGIAYAGGGKLAYSGYSGGMMIHTGYLSAGTITVDGAGGSNGYDMSGMPFGLGGAIKFGFGQHLRVGSEGYSSTLKYGVSGSHCRVGWGGVLVDGIWQLGRFAPFVGATVGGGRVRNLTLSEPPADDFDAEKDVSFRSYPFMALTPFIGVEYSMSASMRLVMKVDWMFSVANYRPDYPSGPRIYLGIAFSRKK